MTEPVLDPHEGARLALGAYVLGGLIPAERDVVDAHLLTCPQCSVELDALTSLPLFLDLVDADEVATMGTRSSAADPALIERVVAAVVAERQAGRRRRRLMSVAAAVVLIAGSSVAGVMLSSSSGSHSTAQAAATFQAVDATSHAWAKIEVQSKAWGASLNLTLTGVPSGEHCKLVAVGRDGTTEVAASWEATYRGAATVTGATSLSLSSTSAYEIVSFTGQRLVDVPTQG